jgi:hypothetical protein
MLLKQLGSVLNTMSNEFQIDLNYVKGDQNSNVGDRANAGVSVALSPRVNKNTLEFHCRKQNTGARTIIFPEKVL